MLRRISHEDLVLLGLENNHPSNLILRSLPVLPKICRPRILNGGKMSSDQVTDLYRNLVNIVYSSE